MLCKDKAGLRVLVQVHLVALHLGEALARLGGVLVLVDDLASRNAWLRHGPWALQCICLRVSMRCIHKLLYIEGYIYRHKSSSIDISNE
jgi:hypothetical protein